MPIELRKCICGCGKSKHGTKRLKFYSPACEARWRRAKLKESKE